MKNVIFILDHQSIFKRLLEMMFPKFIIKKMKDTLQLKSEIKDNPTATIVCHVRNLQAWSDTLSEIRATYESASVVLIGRHRIQSMTSKSQINEGLDLDHFREGFLKILTAA